MATAVEPVQLHQGVVVASNSVQPEVQKYLEAVFAVAPFPEEYVRYRLHLATALPLQTIDAWFEDRRETEKRGAKLPDFSTGAPALQPSLELQPPASSQFALFGASAPDIRNTAQGAAAALSAPGEVADVGRTLAALQNANQRAGLTEGPHEGSPPRLFNPLARLSGPSAFTANGATSGLSNGHSYQPAKPSQPAKPEPAHPGSRFSEADLDVISSLVGLETITSTQEHCGSHSLFMFEQLTALDSLDDESGGAAKRRRTRHQHFWRNTDKLDPEERVYVPTSSIKPALKKRECVVPKHEIGTGERTNAWTVCLTTRGLVSYLNKQISPLGVRMIRALQSSALGGQTRSLDQAPIPESGQNQWQQSVEGNSEGFVGRYEDDGTGTFLTRPKKPRSTKATGEEDAWLGRGDPLYGARDIARGGSNHSSSPASDAAVPSTSEGKQRQQQLEAASTLAGAMISHQPGFEPIPRARKRKPG